MNSGRLSCFRLLVPRSRSGPMGRSTLRFREYRKSCWKMRILFLTKSNAYITITSTGHKSSLSAAKEITQLTMGGKKQQKQQNRQSSSAPSRAASTGPTTTTKTTPRSQTNDGWFFHMIGAIVKIGLWAALMAPFWLLTYSLSLLYGRPPTLVSLFQCVRYLGFVWRGPQTFSKTQVPLQSHLQPLSLATKISLSTTILVHFIKSPLYAFGWILDEILYGRRLSNLTMEEQSAVDNPCFVMSAFRSASTQFGRSLVANVHYQFANSSSTGTTTTQPCFVAPNAMMCAYPYLWLWKLTHSIVGDLPESLDPGDDEASSGITKADVRTKFNSGFTPDSLARHPNDPFQLDTFDGSFLNYHLNGLAWTMCQYFPKELVLQEFNYAHQSDALNQTIWQTHMVHHIDRLARKTLVFFSDWETDEAATTTTTSPRPPQRFLLKGHFLSIGPQLRDHYRHRARFVTVLRDPCARLQSGINYMAVNPSLYSQKGQAIPWKALTVALEDAEAEYSEREQEWFGTVKGETDDRLAVAFDSFVSNKDQTMESIVDWLGLKDHGTVVVGTQGAKSKVATRKTHKASATSKPIYRINRSLAQLGVDETAYRERLKDYLSWMKEVAKTKQN